MNNNAIIVFGSSRRHGYTGQLVDEVARRHQLRIVDVSDYQMTPYDYEQRNRDDDFLPLMREVASYSQIILASPVYWYTMSSQLKVFVDRWNDLLTIEKDLGRTLRGKSGLVISTGGDVRPERSFAECFMHSFQFMGMSYDGLLYCPTDSGRSLDLSEHEAAIAAFSQKIYPISPS
ncbi:MAG: NAD(P)H-dependent oxidoreductase [Ardenticatenales bacterium]|nr:NAD(P)H-dependent oxidoreductase [Ardenticatenales bacterium]